MTRSPNAYSPLLLLALACGSQSVEPAPPPAESAAERSAQTPSAAYNLHEWGLLSVSGNVIEVAAGPGTQVDVMNELTVDKPVVYVHATGPTHFTLSMAAQAGYAIAERWPVSPSISADIPAITQIVWAVEASAPRCTEQATYPTTCTSVDGYCETRELALYETSDASCLRVEGTLAPLLFYRLRATSPEVTQRLPVQIETQGARSAGARTAWRVRRTASGMSAQRIELGAGVTPLPAANGPSGGQGAENAAAWVHQELGRLGLTDAERGAFERAWWAPLFGMDVPSDVLPASDSPVRTSDRETADEDGDDGTVSDETVLDRRQAFRPSANEFEDALIYFLTPAEIDDIARLEATPAAQTIHRAFLVRQDLN